MMDGRNGYRQFNREQVLKHKQKAQGLRTFQSPLIFAALMLTALPTMAQTKSEAPVTAAQDADATDRETATPLPTVTVTGESDYLTRNISSATKTDTPLQDLPQAVTVIPRKLIEDTNMRSMTDAVRYVPGAGSAQGEGNRDTVVLRAGAGSTADFFVDGVRDDVQYYRDFYNIERVEVLKGPSAVIFGRGGSGGVINRVTRVADWSDAREISLQSGSYNDRRATFDLGQGFGERTAGRVTGLYEFTDSYRDYVDLERFGVNPTMAFKLGDQTKLLLSYEYFRDRRTADRGIASQNGLPFETRDGAFFGDPDQSVADAKINVLGATLDHALSESLTLRNATRVGFYDKFYQNVYANTAVNAAGNYTIAGYNVATDRTNLFNQTDLVWKVATGSVKHTVLGGLELGRQLTRNLRQTASGFAGGTTVSASTPTVFRPATYARAGTDADNDGNVTIMATYLQDQLELNEQWQAIAGLRFDSFEVDFNDKRPAPTGSGKVYRYDGLVSPRAGLVYKPVKPLSLYASYSVTYLPVSGEQVGSLSNLNAGLKPEEDTNYEVGAKWEVRPDLALTLALYQLQRQNFTVTDPANPAQQINVDGTTTQGIEVGVNGNITKRWSIAGGYAYQNGTYDKNQSATILKGNRTANVPLNSVSLWNRYDFNNMWGAGIGVINRSSMYAATDNTVRLPGYTRADGAVFFTLNPMFSAQLNVENLFDRGYYLNAHTNNNILPGSPRAVRVGVTAKF